MCLTFQEELLIGKGGQNRFARSKRKGHKNLLNGKNAVQTAKEYKKTVAKGKTRDNIIRFNDLNAEIFEDIILSAY